ncbi:MAG: hypothetical protein LBU16_06210 [Treponema sp.]|nr:hypothetical protein [Treponema sp.]
MSELIVMLTRNDETVKDAKEVFIAARDLPVTFWGFKNIGLPVPQMKDLVDAMKSAGKITFLEVVTLSEEECLKGARMAVDCGFDYLLGTVFYQSVAAYCTERKVKYLPFCGKVYGHPSILEGTPEEVADSAAKLEAAGCHGTDLLAYRNEKDPEEVIKKVVEKVAFPVVVAGSVSTFERIAAIQKINPWTFTIGSALFEGKFGPDKSFQGQIQAVCDYMNNH